MSSQSFKATEAIGGVEHSDMASGHKRVSKAAQMFARGSDAAIAGRYECQLWPKGRPSRAIWWSAAIGQHETAQV